MGYSDIGVLRQSADLAELPVLQRLYAIQEECFPLRKKQEPINAEKFIKRYASKGNSDNRYIALMLKNDGDTLYKLGMEEYEKHPQTKRRLQNAWVLLTSAAQLQQPDAGKMWDKVTELLSNDEYLKARLRQSNLAIRRTNALLAVGLPKKCEASRRDISRYTDVSLFVERVLDYAKEHGGIPTSIPLNKRTELCASDQEPCDGRVDLRAELYVIPRDPLLYGTKNRALTRYFISRTAGGKIVMSAPDAEIEPITISGWSK